MPFEVKEKWSEYPFPSFPISLWLHWDILGPFSFVYTMLSSAFWFWFLILFPSRLNRSDFTFPFPAFFTSFLFPLARAELQKALEAGLGGSSPRGLCREADPLLGWSLCRKTSASLAKWQGWAQVMMSVFISTNIKFHLLWDFSSCGICEVTWDSCFGTAALAVQVNTTS